MVKRNALPLKPWRLILANIVVVGPATAATSRARVEIVSGKPEQDQQSVKFREITPILEFMAWVMVGLAPLLRLANGAPVTTDQWYFQVFVAIASIVTAAILRYYNWKKLSINS